MCLVYYAALCRFDLIHVIRPIKLDMLIKWTSIITSGTNSVGVGGGGAGWGWGDLNGHRQQIYHGSFFFSLKGIQNLYFIGKICDDNVIYLLLKNYFKWGILPGSQWWGYHPDTLHVSKTLQLIWRSCTRRWNLRVLDLQTTRSGLV